MLSFRIAIGNVYLKNYTRVVFVDLNVHTLQQPRYMPYFHYPGCASIVQLVIIAFRMIEVDLDLLSIFYSKLFVKNVVKTIALFPIMSDG